MRSVRVAAAGPEAVEGQGSAGGVSAVAAPSCCTWPLRPEPKFMGRQAGPMGALAYRECPWASVEVRGRTWRSLLRLLPPGRPRWGGRAGVETSCKLYELPWRDPPA